MCSSNSRKVFRTPSRFATHGCRVRFVRCVTAISALFLRPANLVDRYLDARASPRHGCLSINRFVGIAGVDGLRIAVSGVRDCAIGRSDRGPPQSPSHRPRYADGIDDSGCHIAWLTLNKPGAGLARFRAGYGFGRGECVSTFPQGSRSLSRWSAGKTR